MEFPQVPKRTFGLLLLVFLAFSLVGYAVGAASPNTALEAVEKLIGQIGPISDSSFENFVKIFANNSMVALFMFLSGLFFGLGPWFIMAFNGLMVGLVVLAVHRMGGMPIAQIVLGLVPHGVVEIPAIAMAGVAGIVWYRELVKGEGEPAERFKRGVIKGLKLFLLSVALLFVAALIEAYITPKVAGL
ncbi:stage II sporulation protein M [Thermococcus sp. M36]|uniref:stage II sporulation protein M n=1 Tax=Thermococcus sp. M36 TaxID=1638261 RepID=UPI00143CBD93|nr:stage II sporulation protein M [Thermococcus sp. M36]NJE06199.1 stage II sporulation protein M [Thermococcus sp. M36]